MTNDEFRMTKGRTATPHIRNRSAFVIRHPSFVIPFHHA